MSSPSTSRLIVETNWIIDVALKRDPGSLLIRDAAREGKLGVYVPSISLAEAVKAFESMRWDWGRVGGKLQTIITDIERSALLRDQRPILEKARSSLATLEANVERSIWPTIEEVGRWPTVQHTRPGSYAEAGRLRATIGEAKISPADALVLATAIQIARDTGCPLFLSRDKGFHDRGVKAVLKAESLQFFDDPARALQSALRPR